MSTWAWGELLCGPLGSEDASLALRIVRRHVPLWLEEATEAARLFNATGRRRGSLPDCVVVASAVLSNSPLATSDKRDFERFLPLGLMIETVPSQAGS